MHLEKDNNRASLNYLTPRLRTVAAAVRSGSVVADIGTDHGYLVCALVESGICPRGFACDIGELPLESAKREIKHRGLESLVTALLSDGLTALTPDDADDIVIAGMGGELILKIITGAAWTADKSKKFILQPMTKADHLRRGLYRLGFEIISEKAVEDGRFVYTVMSVRFCGKKREIDELFALTGRLLGSSEGDAESYCKIVADRLRSKAKGLAKSHESSAELAETLELISRIENGRG